MTLLPELGRSATPERIVVLDWSLAETILALGRLPLGMAQPAEYSHWENVPQLPSAILDVGLATQPNLEFMQSLEPDLILLDERQSANLRHRLDRIAKVVSITVYNGDGQPLAAAEEATRTLGGLLGAETAAQALLADVHDMAAGCRARLDSATGQKVLCVIPQDERHVWIADRNGLVSNVIERLGLKNAWHGSSSLWGFTQVGIEALAAYEDALMLIGRFTSKSADEIDSSPIWRALPPVRAGRTASLPRFWYFGAIPTAMRLMPLITDGTLSARRG
ncbi:iron complex transport system substrate-binding protein [Arboricoccus pini]|uniref:Iron complex transport system substrate-binding protein n=1 Tax=Arboricoccus pini TaxID=1963835 RepID=A0A212R5C4_9PROT|nr:ABC transporter substrate-binding protein [Arboricoccus pini]SNB67121.1 iron complex transport system substrate-binding protein [Arboricoccus pini]